MTDESLVKASDPADPRLGEGATTPAGGEPIAEPAVDRDPQENRTMTEELLESSSSAHVDETAITAVEDALELGVEQAPPVSDDDDDWGAIPPSSPPAPVGAASNRRATIIGMPAIVAGGTASGRWAPPVPFEVDKRFHLAHELSLGPYGMSYAGFELEGRGRPVAEASAGQVHLTLFHPGFFRGHGRDEQRARVERALRYHSRYVAPTYAIGESFDTVWAVTAPTMGVPLTHWRRDATGIRPQEIYRIVGQLVEAIEAIHAQGGIHGALSPETLRIVKGSVWVTSPWWLEPSEVPAHELQAQRMAWLAPEVQFGERATEASDVFGIGMTLGYLLACGMTEPGHSLLVQGLDVPPAVDDVYVCATARNQESRYQDVAGLRTALEVAAGFEWREAQDVQPAEAPVVAPPVRPRTPQRPTTGRGGAQGTGTAMRPGAVSRPRVVTPAVAPPRDDFEPELPEMPPLVPTAAVLASVPGRLTAASEVEKTWEDDRLPVFEDDPVQPGIELDTRAHDALPAAAAPPSRKTQRVVARTLAIGAPKVTPPKVTPKDTPAAANGAPVTRPRASLRLPRDLRGPELDATDGLPATALTDEIFRELTEGTDLAPPKESGAVAEAEPPPLPSATRPRWRSGWGSTLEALDVGGGQPLPPPPVPAAEPVAPPEGVAGASEATVQVRQMADDMDEPRPSSMHDPVELSEPTVIEGIAPALLEMDVFNADGMPPRQVDLFAPPAPEASSPWSDSPLVPSPGATEFNHLPEPPPPIATSPKIGVAPAPLPPPPPPLPAAAMNSGGFIATPTGPRKAAKRAATQTQLPRAAADATAMMAPVVPAVRDEPRILRDPSGPLAGASASLAGIPIRPEGAPISLATSAVMGLDRRRDGRRTLWLWLGVAAVAVGAVMALVIAISSGSGSGEPSGETTQMAGAGEGPGAGAASSARGLPVIGEVAGKAPGGGGGGGGDGPGHGGGGPGGGGEVGAGVAAVALGGEGDTRDGDATNDAASAGVDSGPAKDGQAGDGAQPADPAMKLAAGEGEVPSAETPVVPAAADGAAPVQVAAVDGAEPEQVAVVDGADGTKPSAAVDEAADGDGAGDAEPVEEDKAAAAKVEAAAKPADEGKKVDFEPKDPNKLQCPNGTLKMKRKISVTLSDGSKADDWDVTCIDRFEYPGGGAVPQTNIDLAGARAACVAKGKRLCSRSEWRRACGYTSYPYGKDYDASACNTAGDDGSPHALVAAGSKKGCMSRSGAFDMVGNAAEWTSDGSINGGTSLRNASDAKCSSASKRVGGAPHIGFRCCADAKE